MLERSACAGYARLDVLHIGEGLGLADVVYLNRTDIRVIIGLVECRRGLVSWKKLKKY
jgi:hypothetical protein